jgi:hypothetical protein
MSNILEQASLVLIPSGYKESKIYSQIPENGNGDLSFTRASNATRVNSAGLIEKVRTNELTYSEDFTNGAWFKTAASVTADATTAPNGTTTADKIVATATSGNHFVTRLSTVLTGEFTFSVFAKASEYSILKLQDVNAGVFNGTFDLSAGTASGTGAAIQSVGSGWYRCSVSYTSSGSSVANALIGAPSTSINYVGDGTSGIFVWGAQLETGVLTDYIPTTTAAVSVGMTANVPRLDYLGSSCPRLLLEPQRTNSVLYSEQFNNAAWATDGNGAGETKTANYAISPDGYQDADRIQLNRTGGSYSRVRQDYVAAGTHTGSIYLKSNTGSSQKIWIRIDGSVSTKITITTSWQRFVVSGSTSAAIELFIDNTDAEIATIADFLAWGAQIEAGAYATSYIPTLGTSVTRVADAASKTGISSLIGQTEGTIYAEFTTSGSIMPVRNVINLNNGGSVDFIAGFYFNNLFYARMRANTGSLIDVTKSGLGEGTHKVAIAYAANDLTMYIDGVLVGQNTGASVSFASPLGEVAIGESTTGLDQLGGTISQALLFKTRLSNTELAQLTTL